MANPTLTQAEIDIQNRLTILEGQVKAALSAPEMRLFRFTGDTVETDFVMAEGWKPLIVFSTAGAQLLEGSADDYTVTESYGTYTVVMAVAPAAADFEVLGVRQ